MADVFISYSRRDAEIVRRLHTRLSEAGRDSWVDWEDIPPTAQWLAEIYAAIEAADTFIFVISPDSLASKVCGLEIEHAVKHNKRFVPLLYRPPDDQPVPEAVSIHNWIYFRDSDSFDDAFALLITALDTDLSYVRAHTRLLVRAVEWDNRGSNVSYLLRGDDLNEAETWLSDSGGKQPAPSEQHTRYIIRSRQAANARQRVTIGGLAGGLVLALALAAFSLVQWNSAVEARATAVAESLSRATQQRLAEDNAGIARQNAATAQAAEGTAVAEANSRATAQANAETQARIAQSGQLAAQALNELVEHPDLAMLLSAEAFRLYDTFESRRSLLSALTTRPQLIMYLREHAPDGDVTALATSPDGRTLASGDDTGTIILWDAATGQRLYPRLISDTFEIIALAFSPDGQRLFSTDTRENLVVWDTTTGQRSAWPHVGDGLDNASVATFSLDGRLKASATFLDEIILWDTATGRRIGPALGGHTELINDLAFSPDGRRLASAGHDGIRLWEVAAGQPAEHHLLSADVTLGQSVEWTPDGKRLAATFIGHGPILWDAATWDVVVQLEGLAEAFEAIQRIVFTPDSTTLIGGQNTGGIVQLDAATLQATAPGFTGHTDEIQALTLLPDGRTLYSGSADGTIIRWDLTGGSALSHPLVNLLESSVVEQAVFSPDSQTLNVLQCADDCTQRNVSRLDAVTGARIGESMQFSSDAFTSFRYAFSPDGRWFVAGSDNTIIRVDLRTSTQVELRGHTADVTAFAISPDGRLLVSGGLDDALRLWNLETGEALGDFGVPTSLFEAARDFWSLAFSPDGKLLVAGDVGGNIRVWDFASRDLLAEYEAHPLTPVETMVFSPDGHILASGGWEGDVVLWDTRLRQRIGQSLQGHERTVNALAFSPDGTILASGGRDARLVLWDVATGQQFGSPLGGHAFSVVHLAFSPDGRWLASSGPNEVLVWDMSAEGWRETACRRSRLNLTLAEWERYLPGQAYRPTCPTSIAGLPELVSRAETFALEGDAARAETSFQTAVEWVQQTGDNRYAALVCFRGALFGYAQRVLPACDYAVQLWPELGVPHHRRGIVRALLGDYAGAIEDFRVMLDWLKQWDASYPEPLRGYYDVLSPDILAWIDELEAGRSPFDAGTLAALRET